MKIIYIFGRTDQLRVCEHNYYDIMNLVRENNYLNFENL